MATRKPFTPFLDIAREKAKEGVFGVPMLTILWQENHTKGLGTAH